MVLDRASDGAELEIRPTVTSRGARWTRAETLLGFGLVVLLFGGALVNALANTIAEPKTSPASSAGSVVGEATNGPVRTKAPGTPRPTIEATPAITPVVPCGSLVGATGPPLVNLVGPGIDAIPGTVGAFTWFGLVQPPSQIQLEESGAIPFEGDIELQIGGEICATRWTIVSTPAEQGRSTVQETSFSTQGQSDWGSFTTNRSDNPIISQQNHITAKPVGLGRVYVRAVLNFEGGQQAQVYWLIRIRAFDAPLIHVIGADGTDVTPVVGCGVSVSTGDNWFGEECPQGSWPLLEDLPILTVHADDIVRVEVPGWPLDYWGVQWAREADVHPGSDPGTVGNFGGTDSLNPTVVRWLVPPAGDWAIRIDLSHPETNRQYYLPVHVRLRVLP